MSVELFMNSDLNIEKIALACYVGKGKGMQTHTNRPTHGLALHTSGIKKYLFKDGKTLLVHKNELIYLPKGSTYEVSSVEAGDCYAVNFDVSQPFLCAPFVCRIKNNTSMLAHFKSAKSVWEMKKAGSVSRCKADLYNIICILQQEYVSGYTSKSSRELILPAIEYIHENYTTESLSIARLAELCSISPEYFRSIFKTIYGISPKKYITDLKITRARELLDSGMYSVTDTAFLSGYTDLSHFSREFKKAVGTAPKYYI